MKKISQETAVQLGLKRFFTGAPCRNGHICERGSFEVLPTPGN